MQKLNDDDDDDEGEIFRFSTPTQSARILLTFTSMLMSTTCSSFPVLDLTFSGTVASDMTLGALFLGLFAAQEANGRVIGCRCSIVAQF